MVTVNSARTETVIGAARPLRMCVLSMYSGHIHFGEIAAYYRPADWEAFARRIVDAPHGC